MSRSLQHNKYLMMLLCWLAALFSIGLFLKNSWVAEDGFIILRSVEQFLQGNGFRWNPHERVQVFTSPLWYLLLIASTVLCKTLYLNLLGLSLLLHGMLLSVMALLIRHTWRWIAAVLLLTLSQAFFDFTSSGLEYPLIYCLVAAFVLLYLRGQLLPDRYWLAACSGLALITRHDLLFLLSPLLLHLAWVYHKQLPLRQQCTVALLFLAPLVCWTLFSLLYYGMPFPNTAYAKLGISGISRLDRLERGFIYLGISLKMDPITPLAIGLAMLQCACSRETRFRAVGCSLLLALAYITWIGADYMLGRFYAPLYLVAVLTLCCFPWQRPYLSRPLAIGLGVASSYLLLYTLVSNLETVGLLLQRFHWPEPEPVRILVLLGSISLVLILASASLPRTRSAIALLFLLLLANSTQQLDSPWRTGYRNWGKQTDFDMWWNLSNVSRERYFIYHWTSLYAWLNRDPARPFPDHPWCHEGIAMPAVEVIGFAGITPYCMGTAKIAVDIKAITDPLLTRMPKIPDAIWSSGGTSRYIPAGYIASLQDQQNRIEDPDLARYYDKLRLLTQSDALFSRERLATIIAFNLGHYDSWLKAHNARTFSTAPPKQDDSR